MTSAPGFITLHDGEANRRKFPDGKPVQVRAQSIDMLRGYPDERVRTVISVHGAYLHVIETEEQIFSLMEDGTQ
jgi:hypothetical protein